MLSGVINTNVNALYALNSLSNTTNTTNTLEQELSTGLSINSPADNPAGYIAAQGFSAEIGGVAQATSNANQAISLVQTADGAIGQQVNILQNILSIASQAANGGSTSQQLAALQQVVSQLTTQISSIASQTNFNGVNLLDGSFQGQNFQVGAGAGQTIGLSIANTSANQLGAYESSVAGTLYTTTAPAPAALPTTPATHTPSRKARPPVRSPPAVSAFPVQRAMRPLPYRRSISRRSACRKRSTPTRRRPMSARRADTSVALTVTAGSFAFTLGNGTGAAQTNGVTISSTVTSVSQSGLSNLVNSINENTGTTGITASVNSSAPVVAYQCDRRQYLARGLHGHRHACRRRHDGQLDRGTNNATIQGLATLQSTQSFSLAAAASDVGLGIGSAQSAVSSVNVSTTAGATAAINVVNYALQQLESVGGGLGATQQRLQATVSNLQNTTTNLTAAQGVVQDANIPQVSTQLTQEEILQQAGVSALTQSNTLQQSFLKLLQ